MFILGTLAKFSEKVSLTLVTAHTQTYTHTRTPEYPKLYDCMQQPLDYTAPVFSLPLCPLEFYSLRPSTDTLPLSNLPCCYLPEVISSSKFLQIILTGLLVYSPF